MYPRTRPLPEVTGASRYCVTGFDKAGNVLFSETVEAISETDAQLVALRELRKTPNGFEKANRAERLVAELRWRNVGGRS
jgi:hypothetical protein